MIEIVHLPGFVETQWNLLYDICLTAAMHNCVLLGGGHKATTVYAGVKIILLFTSYL